MKFNTYQESSDGKEYYDGKRWHVKPSVARQESRDYELHLNQSIDNAIERMKNGSPTERKEAEKQYSALSSERRNIAQAKFNLRHSTSHLKDL